MKAHGEYAASKYTIKEDFSVKNISESEENPAKLLFVRRPYQQLKPQIDIFALITLKKFLDRIKQHNLFSILKTFNIFWQGTIHVTTVGFYP